MNIINKLSDLAGGGRSGLFAALGAIFGILFAVIASLSLLKLLEVNDVILIMGIVIVTFFVVLAIIFKIKEANKKFLESKKRLESALKNKNKYKHSSNR